MEKVRYMVTFAHVVKAGSFVGAAERLKLAPSVVSKHISKLESEMGVRLLNRSTRSLSLTEAGTAFHEHCARIVEELEQSEEAVASLQAEPQGRLRISTTSSIINSLLTPMIPGFLEQYPMLELELVAGDRLVDLVEEGYDMALRITGEPSEHLVARYLSPINFRVMGSPAYFHKHGRPERLEDLQRHICLNYPEPLAQKWIFREGQQRVEVDIQSPVQVNSVDALRQLALAGIGLALLPTYAVASELTSGKLQCALPGYQGFGEAKLYAVYLQNRYGSPKIKAFVEYITEYARRLQLETLGCGKGDKGR